MTENARQAGIRLRAEILELDDTPLHDFFQAALDFASRADAAGLPGGRTVWTAAATLAQGELIRREIVYAAAFGETSAFLSFCQNWYTQPSASSAANISVGRLSRICSRA